MLTYLTASWCQPCKKYLPVVQAEAAARGIEVTVLDIDTPHGAATAQLNQIQTVPAIILTDGTVVSGPRTKRQLSELLDV